MKKIKKKIIGIAAGLVLVFLGFGFVNMIKNGFMPFSGTRAYKPFSSEEEKYYSKCIKTVFPSDIKKEPNAHGDDIVAWAGVIKKINTKVEGEFLQLQITLEHRYYDWLEDFSVRREKILLSPRGEGVFFVNWAVPLIIKEKVLKEVTINDLIISYGNPQEMEDGQISLSPTMYLRAISKKFWRDDVLNYGKPEKKMNDSQRK